MENTYIINVGFIIGNSKKNRVINNESEYFVYPITLTRIKGTP